MRILVSNLKLFLLTELALTQWIEMGPWYFKKNHINDSFGNVYFIKDKMGLRIVTDYDIKQIAQYCK